jgi:hypothetical protein
MDRSVVAVVGTLLWAMRRRTVVLMVTVGVVVLLVGGMALANVPPPDPGTTPPGDTTPRYQFVALAFAMSLQHVPPPPGEVYYVQNGITLKDAKFDALYDCRESGNDNPTYYEKDCQGGVWVRNGYLAFAIEPLPDPGDKVKPGYEQAYGLAYAQTFAEAKARALDNCSLDDPQYKRCRVVVAQASENPHDPNAFKGGSW